MFRLLPYLRTFDVLMVLILIAAVAWTFKVKNDTDDALERLAELEKQIAAEESEIEILKSDWGLLTNPARLQKLYELYDDQLQMQGIEPGQIVDLETLPPFKATVVPQGSDTSQADAAGISQMHTGSVPSGEGNE